MKHVLMIGMDSVSGRVISRALAEYDDVFQVLVPENDEQARAISGKIKPDLLILDQSRPEQQNLELIHHIKKSVPEIPVIAIIDVNNPLPELKIKYPGNMEYINKPVETDLLADLVLKLLQVNMNGQVRGISLPSFLQMIEMEEKTCYLKIKKKRNTGYLHFKKGELIAAKTDTTENEEAAYEIIGWENPTISIFDSGREMEKRIDATLMNILIETLKRKDEQQDIREKPNPQPPEFRTPKIITSGLYEGLEIGTRLHLKHEHATATSRSSLIGIKHEAYLIVAPPRSLDTFLEKSRSGRQIVVTYLFNGIIFAFKAAVLQYIPEPIDLLFLTYPRQVERRHIRSLKRIKCFIPARAACNHTETIGSILDINIRGCGCLLQSLDSRNSSACNPDEPISLKCRFPGIEGEVDIHGRIKNRRTTSEGTTIGIAFMKRMNPEIEEIITQYIISVGDLD